MGHINIENILAKEQHRFLKGKSCLTNLLECLDDWSNVMDVGNLVYVVYIELQKAFDTILFERFLFKLKQVSIRGPQLT